MLLIGLVAQLMGDRHPFQHFFQTGIYFSNFFIFKYKNEKIAYSRTSNIRKERSIIETFKRVQVTFSPLKK